MSQDSKTKKLVVLLDKISTSDMKSANKSGTKVESEEKMEVDGVVEIDRAVTAGNNNNSKNDLNQTVCLGVANSPQIAKVKKRTRSEIMEESAKKKLAEQERKERDRKEREEASRKKKETEEKLKIQKEKERKEKEEISRKKKEAEEKLKRERQEERERKAKERKEAEEVARKKREEDEAVRLKKKEEKEEEKRKEDEEKIRKHEEKRKEEEEKNRKAEKVKAHFESFFVKKESPKKPSSDVAESGKSAHRFMQFQPKEHMTIAPICRRIDVTKMNDDDRLKFQTDLESLLLKKNDDDGDERETGLSIVDVIRQIRASAQKHNQLARTATATTTNSRSRKNTLSKRVDSNVSADLEVIPVEKTKFKCKYLHFDAKWVRRPPYYGTWRKRSARIGARRPFTKDEEMLNYEHDSDDEWEVEPDGESICGDESGGEDGEETVDEDDEDGFFVPHGHLSDDELDEADIGELDPAARKAKEAACSKQYEMEQKQKRAQQKKAPTMKHYINVRHFDDAIGRETTVKLGDPNDLHYLSKLKMIFLHPITAASLPVDIQADQSPKEKTEKAEKTTDEAANENSTNHNNGTLKREKSSKKSKNKKLKSEENLMKDGETTTAVAVADTAPTVPAPPKSATPSILNFMSKKTKQVCKLEQVVNSSSSSNSSSSVSISVSSSVSSSNNSTTSEPTGATAAPSPQPKPKESPGGPSLLSTVLKFTSKKTKQVCKLEPVVVEKSSSDKKTKDDDRNSNAKCKDKDNNDDDCKIVLEVDTPAPSKASAPALAADSSTLSSSKPTKTLSTSISTAAAATASSFSSPSRQLTPSVSTAALNSTGEKRVCSGSTGENGSKKRLRLDPSGAPKDANGVQLLTAFIKSSDKGVARKSLKLSESSAKANTNTNTNTKTNTSTHTTPTSSDTEMKTVPPNKSQAKAKPKSKTKTTDATAAAKEKESGGKENKVAVSASVQCITLDDDSV